MDSDTIALIAVLREIIDTEPLYPDEDGDYFCVYCDTMMDEDGLHDRLCPWMRLRGLWEPE